MGQVVNLGFGEELRIDALARAVLSAAGRTDLKPVFEAPRPADVPRLWVDTTKLRAALDFKPRTTLNEGLARTLDHFKRLLAANPSCLEQMTTRNWER